MHRRSFTVFAALAFAACGQPMDLTRDSGITVTNDSGITLTDGGTDRFAGTWDVSGAIGPSQFEFPLKIVLASDGNYRAEYAGCVMPLLKTSATHLDSQAATCTTDQTKLQDSKLDHHAPTFGSDITLSFSTGSVDVVADILTAKGTMTNQGSPVNYTFSGSRL